jgi:hypothetical protein
MIQFLPRSKHAVYIRGDKMAESFKEKLITVLYIYCICYGLVNNEVNVCNN